MKVSLTGSAVLAVVVLSASGERGDKSRLAVIDCDRGSTTQAEMNICAEQAAQKSMQKLASLLQELRAKLAAQEWAELTTIQAKWGQFREDDCSWQRGFFKGSSAAPLMYWQCIHGHTVQRIDRLKPFLCEGWGMTGPCEESQKY